MFLAAEHFFVGIVIDLFICCFLFIIAGSYLYAVSAILQLSLRKLLQLPKPVFPFFFFFSCFKSKSFFDFSGLWHAMEFFPEKGNDFLTRAAQQSTRGINEGTCHYNWQERNEVPVHRGLSVRLNDHIPISALNCTMSRMEWSRSRGICKGKKQILSQNLLQRRACCSSAYTFWA